MGQLTKKDFVKFAENASKIEDDIERMATVQGNIDYLRMTNPRFDAQRFKDYVEKKVKERRLKL